jgi:hypothetical protein
MKAIRNPIRHGFAVLTPGVFRAIDIIARRHAGRPFCIKSIEDMEGSWGRCGFMAGGVVRDVRRLTSRNPHARVYEEIGDFSVVNQISIAEFHDATRPEIDLSQVPAERAYEYVAWHEVGHIVDDFDAWAGILPMGHAALQSVTEDATAWRREIHQLNEILADRYAWAMMFPGQRMPVHDGGHDMAAWATEWITRLSAAGVRRGRARERSIDTSPLTWVPTEHMKPRIPWSRLAAPELKKGAPWLTRLKRARIDERNRHVRWFRQHAKEMAALWARVAKKPAAEAMKYAREGRMSSYMDAEAKKLCLRHIGRQAARHAAKGA